MANTTPFSARTVKDSSDVLASAPGTRPSVVLRLVTVIEVFNVTPASIAERIRRAISALPLRSCIPRRCNARSNRWRPNRLATWAKDAGDRVMVMKARKSAPA